jgi:hypothetical protein
VNAANWRKSTHSNGGTNCVELAALPDGDIGMRNSRHPEGAVLAWPRQAIAEMLAAMKANEFDDLA